jgi:membrane protease subunit HflK
MRNSPPDFPQMSQLPFNPSLILPVLAAVVVALFFLGSVYTVPPDSEAVIQRFGAYVRTDQPGLRFKMPFGIDSMTVVPVRRQLKLEFGFSTPRATNIYQASKEPSLESAMLTGDLNAVEVEWSVQYRIADSRKYMFSVFEPEETLRAGAEAVMREVIGDRTVDEAITVGREEIEGDVLLRLRNLASAYRLGISIDTIQLRGVNPPRAVRNSFNEVNQAQQERERTINLARGEYNKAVPKARGDADRRIAEAEGEAVRRLNEAAGDAALFNSVYTAYKSAPDVTRARLYFETMTKVYSQADRKVVVDESVKGLLPLLNVNGAR